MPPTAGRCRRSVARSAEGPSGPTILEAEIISESSGKKALERLEKALEDQIEQAKEGDPEDRIRDLARLLVMAKTAEGIALTATTAEVTGAVQKAVAETLAEFVGKKDYNFDDVSQAVGKKLKNTVGDNGVAIKEATLQMDGAAKAAVANFTGKEKYEFGDISREIDRRAKDVVNSFTGKDEYEFGDITKEVLKRGGNAVKDFTGREEYQFGDISKTVWKNLFGGDKREKRK